MESYYPNQSNPDVKLYVPNPETAPTGFVIELMKMPDNRMTISFYKSYNAALDQIERIMDSLPDSKKSVGGSLITTSTGKFFSNGLDQTHSLGNPEFGKVFTATLARILCFRLPTVAAINGHAFAGGCILAMAHDYIVMNENRGYICMNEIDLDVPLHIGIMELLRTRISQRSVLNKCVLEGHRFTASEGVHGGFIDVAVPGNEVLPTAINIATRVSKKAYTRGITFGAMKSEKNRTAIIALRTAHQAPGSYLNKL